MGDFDGGKISIADLFSDKFIFTIPEYQRPFVWGQEEFDELFEDIRASMEDNDPSYFLGAIVLHRLNDYDELTKRGTYAVVDGQQRITSLLILLAVIRDLLGEVGAAEEDASKKAQYLKYSMKVGELLYQEADRLLNRAEQVRLTVWPDDRYFFEVHVLKPGGTSHIRQSPRTETQQNMLEAMRIFRSKFLNSDGVINVDLLLRVLQHVLSRTYVLYTRTADQALAFTQFIRLNARGVDLQSSDLLKTENLRVIKSDNERYNCAKLWTDIEKDLGRDGLERLLAFIRDIKLKQKARRTIWEEYQQIFKKGLLERGNEFFEHVRIIADIYNDLVLNVQSSLSGVDEGVRYENLVVLMRDFIPSTDWVPPLLHFRGKFRSATISDIWAFLERLERKYTVSWVCGLTPTQRLWAMYELVDVIDQANSLGDVLNAKELDVDSMKSEFLSVISSKDFYSKRFCKYVLLRLDLAMRAGANVVQAYRGDITVEHVLPRNPGSGSPWLSLFDDRERDEWTNRLGNLVLLSRKTNSRSGRKSFAEKITEGYFVKSMQDFQLTNQMASYTQWTPNEVSQRHRDLLQLAERTWF